MPHHVLTIYNCGTNFHRASGDIVALLYGLTLPDQRFITDGVGSGSLTPNQFGGRANPGGANKVAGLLFGVGMDANVDAAVQTVRALRPSQLNLCGWSRGGVTCTKISSALSRDAELQHIPVSIFAIDPVPGSTGPAGAHAWKQIELTRNVRHYTAVFAQHDSRAGFAPTYPSTGGATDVTVEIMPGAHSTIAKRSADLPDAADLVYDMAKRFLQLHGTAFTDRSLLSASALINAYAKVQIDFQRYRELAKPDPNWLQKKLGVSADRTVKDDRGRKVGTMLIERAGFFVNEHHRDLFQAKYFSLTQELDRPVDQAFRHAAPGSGWVRDAERLLASEPDAYRQLAYYIGLIG